MKASLSFAVFSVKAVRVSGSMEMLWQFGLYLMALFYVLAGLNHFRVPEFYRPMMPPYLPAPDALIALSGVAEVLLGLLLLWPAARPWAAWGVILLLVAIFPANLYMYQMRATTFANIPANTLLLRLPIQLLLIAWAFVYTRSAAV